MYGLIKLSKQRMIVECPYCMISPQIMTIAFGGITTLIPNTVVVGLYKRKDWVVRPGTRKFRVRGNGYINTKIGGELWG